MLALNSYKFHLDLKWIDNSSHSFIRRSLNGQTIALIGKVAIQFKVVVPDKTVLVHSLGSIVLDETSRSGLVLVVGEITVHVLGIFILLQGLKFFLLEHEVVPLSDFIQESILIEVHLVLNVIDFDALLFVKAINLLFVSHNISEFFAKTQVDLHFELVLED